MIRCLLGVIFRSRFTLLMGMKTAIENILPEKRILISCGLLLNLEIHLSQQRSFAREQTLMKILPKPLLRSVTVIASIYLYLCPLPTQGNDYNSGVSANVLKKSTVTANGKKIVYPATDKAEVTATMVELAPCAETGWHAHPIPVYAYVVAGTLDVELEGGQVISYQSGDVIIEAVNTLHNGGNQGFDTVRLAVFYTGVEGIPNVVKLAPPHP